MFLTVVADDGEFLTVDGELDLLVVAFPTGNVFDFAVMVPTMFGEMRINDVAIEFVRASSSMIAIKSGF